MSKFLTLLLLSSLLLTACNSEPVPLNPQEDNDDIPGKISQVKEDPVVTSSAVKATPVVLQEEEMSAYRAHVTASHSGFTPGLIEVSQGQKVSLSLESIDVRHSFSIPALGVRTEIPARQTVTLEFIANQKGSFEFLSDVYSGANTDALRGTLLVQ